MGDRLLKYYDWVNQQGGLALKMRLAMKTNIPSAQAKDAPDSTENITKMHMAAKDIAGKEPPRF